MALTGAVYKWRLDNTSYAYITDESETGGTPFIATNENNIDEGKIKEKVVSWNEETYCDEFDKMVTMVHGYKDGKYSNLQFLDCSIYLNEFSDCPDEVLKPLIPTDIALTVEATPDTIQAEFIDEGTIFADGEYLKQFKLKLNIPTEEGGVEYTAGENIDITTGNTISALGYRYDQDKDSIAVGSGSIGLGMYSHAEGVGTQANGNASHAEGYQTESRGNFSHTEGRETLVQGTCGHAEGYKTTSQYIASHAEGQETTASANYSHAEGHGAQANGEASHAEGSGSIGLGIWSHAEGHGTQSNGEASHAEGYGSIADGNYSHAEGYDSIAEGNYSHAEGYESHAEGDYSHAEGENTIASGYYSHAEGENTLALGSASHAEGLGTITNNVGEHAEGKYNHSNSDTENTNNIGLNTIHSIGIGTGDNDRKNAFEVMENGDVYVYNVGDYDGTNATENDTKTLQEVLEELNNGGSGGSGITYVGGNNIDITGNTITAKGYTYNNVNNTETLEFSDNILSLGGGNATIHYDNNAVSTNGLNVTAASSINIDTSDGNINIAAEDGEIIIGASSNIKITGDDDISIDTVSGMYITASDKFSVDSSSFSSTCPITAEVNGVENVYLGCPIGTIVMWAGQTAPNGWLLCDGTGIPVYLENVGYISKACTIQGKSLNDNELTHLVFTVFRIDDNNSLYGRANYYYVEDKGWIKEGNSGGTDDNKYFMIESYTTDVKEALKFYSDYSKFVNTLRQEVEATPYQCINLPDLQQKFPLGAMQGGTIGSNSDGTPYNTSLGDTGGTSTNTLVMANLPQNMANYYLVTSSSQPQASKSLNDGASGNYFVNEGTCLHSNGIGQPSSTAFTNMPPYLAINFIIKYK